MVNDFLKTAVGGAQSTLTAILFPSRRPSRRHFGPQLLGCGKNPRRRIGKLVTVGGLYPIWTAYWTSVPQDGRLDRRVHCAVSTLEIFRSISNSVSSAGWLSREVFLLAQCWGRN